MGDPALTVAVVPNMILTVLALQVWLGSLAVVATVAAGLFAQWGQVDHEAIAHVTSAWFQDSRMTISRISVMSSIA